MKSKLLLHDFKVLYATSEEFKQQIENYHRVVQTKEWKFFKDAILTIKGMVYTELLSARFTNLEPREKDTEQKIYYEIVKMLDFLSNPLTWMKKRSKFSKKPTANLKGEGKPKP
jgi:hypothetical protein